MPILGMETQRHWSDLALERSTPLLFGLSRLVTLFGQALHPEGQVPVAQATSVGPEDVSHITHPSGCGVRAPLDPRVLVEGRLLVGGKWTKSSLD